MLLQKIPEQLSNILFARILSIGGADESQLSTSSSFVWKFTLQLKISYRSSLQALLSNTVIGIETQ